MTFIRCLFACLSLCILRFLCGGNTNSESLTVRDMHKRSRSPSRRIKSPKRQAKRIVLYQSLYQRRGALCSSLGFVYCLLRSTFHSVALSLPRGAAIITSNFVPRPVPYRDVMRYFLTVETAKDYASAVRAAPLPAERHQPSRTPPRPALGRAMKAPQWQIEPSQSHALAIKYQIININAFACCRSTQMSSCSFAFSDPTAPIEILSGSNATTLNCIAK